MRQAIFPAFRDETALAEGVDIGKKPKRHYVGGLPALNDRSRLSRRPAMRLLDAHVFSGRFRVARGELRVQALVEFAGRIIGNIQQFIAGSGVEILGRDEANRQGGRADGCHIEPSGLKSFTNF